MRSKIRLFVGLTVLLFVCSSMTAAWGRAGGGGGYSGGSSSYSSSSYSGGSYSYSGGSNSYSEGGGGRIEGPASFSDFLWALAIAGGLLLLGVIQSSLLGNSGGSNQTRSISRVPRQRPPPQVLAAVREQVRAADPTFNSEIFLQRFADAFMQIQEAWQNHDMRTVRHFVSDGIFERFTLQIDEQKAFGYRDKMSDINIHFKSLVEFTQDDAFDVLTVQANVTAVDYRVSLTSGKYVSGDRSPESFIEMWTFIRRRGVHSLSSDGLIEGNCPNCDDSIQLNQADQCESCKAHLRSGEYDWVLSEITQSCEWHPRSVDELEIARRYRAEHDPGFSSQHLEDRASVIFWREAMAYRLGHVRPLMKMATPEYCEQVGNHVTSVNEQATRRFYGGRSVGSVDLLGIITAEDADYALVEIRWSANTFAAEPDGSLQDLGQWRRHRSLFVLMRQRGVTSKLARAIESAHCPQCGAAESTLTSHACEFCNTVLNDGSHEWVLFDTAALPHSEEAAAWLTRLQHAATSDASQTEQSLPEIPAAHIDILSWAVHLLTDSADINDKNREFLHWMGERIGVSGNHVDAMIQAASGVSTDDVIDAAVDGKFDAPLPQTTAETRQLLSDLSDIALSDGVIEEHELGFMTTLGEAAGLSQQDVRLIANKRRAARARLNRRNEATSHSTNAEFQSVLLQSLLCVTAADRKVTRAERAAVIAAMRHIGRSISQEELRDAIEEFIMSQQHREYAALLKESGNALRRQCTGRSHQRLARKALAVVARADATPDERTEEAVVRLNKAINTAM